MFCDTAEAVTLEFLQKEGKLWQSEVSEKGETDIFSNILQGLRELYLLHLVKEINSLCELHVNSLSSYQPFVES